MKETYVQDTTFERADFSSEVLPKGEYENCTFKHCNFANADLMHVKFVDSEFIECDFSMAKVNDAAFRTVRFRNSKMLGVQFNNCNEFGLAFTFEGCILNHAGFYRRKIGKTIFRNCVMHETDFTEADLSGAIFDACDLEGAVFEGTNLEKTDLRTATNFIIDPAKNKIKKAKFSLHGLPGLLVTYDIHIEL